MPWPWLQRNTYLRPLTILLCHSQPRQFCCTNLWICCRASCSFFAVELPGGPILALLCLLGGPYGGFLRIARWPRLNSSPVSDLRQAPVTSMRLRFENGCLETHVLVPFLSFCCFGFRSAEGCYKYGEIVILGVQVSQGSSKIHVATKYPASNLCVSMHLILLIVKMSLG